MQALQVLSLRPPIGQTRPPGIGRQSQTDTEHDDRQLNEGPSNRMSLDHFATLL